MEHNVPLAMMQDMRADAQEKRDAIITASLDLFAVEGFNVPFRTIAAKADVGVATVHRHFPERLDLIMAVARRFWDRIRAIIEKHDSEWSSDPEETLFRILRELSTLHPLTMFTLGEPVITSLGVDITPSNPIFQEAFRIIEKLTNNAKKYDLIPQDLPTERFYGGFAVISRQAPERLDIIVPGYMDWLIRVYLRGLKP